MYRGTTPTITMKLNTDLSFDLIKEIWVTFKSWKTEVTKTIENCHLDDENKTITVELSQEDTLSFGIGEVAVQLRFVLDNGQAFASPIRKISSEKILKDGVIKYEQQQP